MKKALGLKEDRYNRTFVKTLWHFINSGPPPLGSTKLDQVWKFF